MSSDTDTTTEVGIDGRLGWPISGAIGGAIGALAFGLLVWLVDPAVIETTIPGAYGLESTGVVGWAIQLVHGVVLGLVFAFVVTRQSILGVLRTSVETDVLARTSLAARLAAAGFVFGLAVWAVLPVIVLPVVAGAIGAEQAAEFPGLAAEGLVGHLLFGTVLGVVFALTTDLSGRASKDVLEDS